MGWASGLQAGIRLGEQIRQGQLQRQLADEAAKYTPTEGAYGQELQSNIEQVQGLKQQAIAGGMTPEMAAQQYDPSIAELTRRSGLTSADYSLPTDTSGKNYATLAEAQKAAAPMRSEGLANVYRQAGEIDKADELLARAQQSRTAAIQEKAAGLQVNALQRREDVDIANKNALAAIEARRAAGEPIDQNILSTMASQYGADPKHLMDNELSKLGYDEKTLKLETVKLQKNLTKAQMGGIDGMNKFLAETFDPNKNDDIVPTIKQTKNGLVVMYGDQVLSEYGTHKDLNALVANVNGMITGDPLGAAKTLSEINYRNSLAAAHQATAAAGKNTFGQTVYGVEIGKDGNPVQIGLTPVRNTRAGTVTYERQVLPEGFVPADELSDTKLRPLAEQMVKNRQMQPTLKDGKKVPHTIESALAQLRSERMARARAGSGAVNPMADVAAKIKGADAKNAPAAQAAQPSRGIFTGDRGETQLLQPAYTAANAVKTGLFDLNEWRRRMALESSNSMDGLDAP